MLTTVWTQEGDKDLVKIDAKIFLKAKLQESSVQNEYSWWFTSTMFDLNNIFII